MHRRSGRPSLPSATSINMCGVRMCAKVWHAVGVGGRSDKKQARKALHAVLGDSST